jgi:uncharacterized protein
MSVAQVTSGKMMDLAYPRIEAVDFDDIAEQLAKQPRFAGATPNAFFSVAQHSVHVADLVYSRSRDCELAAYGLLHDGHEAYLGDDTTPKRQALGVIALEVYGPKGHEIVMDVMQAQRWRLDAVILQAAGLKFPVPATTAVLIKRVDLAMLKTERLALMPAGPPWPMLEKVEPLPVAIAPWDWQFAKQCFLRRFERYVLRRHIASPSLVPAQVEGGE